MMDEMREFAARMVAEKIGWESPLVNFTLNLQMMDPEVKQHVGILCDRIFGTEEQQLDITISVMPRYYTLFRYLIMGPIKYNQGQGIRYMVNMPLLKIMGDIMTELYRELSHGKIAGGKDAAHCP